MKKYFLVVLLMFLTSCISKYETNTLFEDGGYKYNITYPVSKNNEWFLYNGSTDASVIKLKDGTSLYATAIIIKQKTFGFGGSIEVYILNKDSTIYNALLKFSNENSRPIFLNIQDKEKKLSFENIYKWFVDKNDKTLVVLYNLNQNKVILFAIDENSKNKKEMAKDIYKILSSLTREKINNQNDNAKQ